MRPPAHELEPRADNADEVAAVDARQVLLDAPAVLADVDAAPTVAQSAGSRFTHATTAPTSLLQRPRARDLSVGLDEQRAVGVDVARDARRRSALFPPAHGRAAEPARRESRHCVADLIAPAGTKLRQRVLQRCAVSVDRPACRRLDRASQFDSRSRSRDRRSRGGYAAARRLMPMPTTTASTRRRADRLAQHAAELSPRPADDEVVRPLQLDRQASRALDRRRRPRRRPPASRSDSAAASRGRAAPRPTE